MLNNFYFTVLWLSIWISQKDKTYTGINLYSAFKYIISSPQHGYCSCENRSGAYFRLDSRQVLWCPVRIFSRLTHVRLPFAKRCGKNSFCESGMIYSRSGTSADFFLRVSDPGKSLGSDDPNYFKYGKKIFLKIPVPYTRNQAKRRIN